MNRTFKDKFWDAMIWIGIFTILIWALLKSFGVVHSLVWIEMVPYYGLGVVFLGSMFKFGKMVEMINHIGYDVKILKDKFEIFENRFSKVENEHNLCMQGKLNLH